MNCPAASILEYLTGIKILNLHLCLPKKRPPSLAIFTTRCLVRPPSTSTRKSVNSSGNSSLPRTCSSPKTKGDGSTRLSTGPRILATALKRHCVRQDGKSPSTATISLTLNPFQILRIFVRTLKNMPKDSTGNGRRELFPQIRTIPRTRLFVRNRCVMKFTAPSMDTLRIR